MRGGGEDGVLRGEEGARDTNNFLSFSLVYVCMYDTILMYELTPVTLGGLLICMIRFLCMYIINMEWLYDIIISVLSTVHIISYHTVIHNVMFYE